MREAEIASRLEKLERDNKRLKAVVLAAAVVAAALSAIYATRPLPRVVRAREFEVVDNSGDVRARLSGDWNEPTVGLFDTHGRARAMMSVLPNGSPAIVLSDAQSNPRAVIGVNPGGAPGITLYDAQGNGKTRATMGVNPDGSPVIGVYDAQGIPRATMQVNPDGLPMISLDDARGYSMDLGSTATEDATTGEMQQSSAASIVMFGNDKQHHVIWHAP